MIRRLTMVLKNLQIAAGPACSFCDHLRKIIPRDKPRTAAGHQNAAFPEHSQASFVKPNVSLQSPIEPSAGPRHPRRIQDHAVKQPASCGKSIQRRSHVLVDPFTPICDSVEYCVVAGQHEGRFRGINPGHRSRLASLQCRDAKAPGKAEGIQHFSIAQITTGRKPIIALIQVTAGFLTALHIDTPGCAVFLDKDRLSRLGAGEQPIDNFKTF
jgi:hypothetical protein